MDAFFNSEGVDTPAVEEYICKLPSWYCSMYVVLDVSGWRCYFLEIVSTRRCYLK
jgi:hypothetical protein